MRDPYYQRRLDEPSNSTLRHFRRSPMAYRDHVLSGDAEDTAAMSYGRAFHCALLEPTKFRTRYVTLPSMALRSVADRGEYIARCSDALGFGLDADPTDSADAVRAAVAAEAAEHGRHVLSESDLATLHAQVASLNLSEHSMARRIVASGCHEQIHRWVDEASGVSCKAKLDGYTESVGILWDLKTTQDATAEGFRRALWTYGYHYQEAMYRRALRAAGKAVRDAYFVLCETTRPYHWNVVSVAEEDVQTADDSISSSLRSLRRCLDTDTWPGLIGAAPEIVSMRRPHHE